MNQSWNQGERIYGLGIDIVSIDRMRRLLRLYPKRLPQRLLHPKEHQDFAKTHNKPAFLARRFAAKEAISKALGKGLQAGIYARRICIDHNRWGAPIACLSHCLLPSPQHRLWLSISDERDYSIAQALCTQVLE